MTEKFNNNNDRLRSIHNEYKNKDYIVFSAIGKKPYNITGFHQLTLEQSKDIEFQNGASGIALVCGKESNIIAIDVDVDDYEIAKQIPFSRIQKVGLKGFTRFFQYENYIESTGAKGIIEILSNGTYTILPPSIHPDTGNEYFWTDDRATLLTVDRDNIPYLSKDEYERIVKLSFSLGAKRKNEGAVFGRNDTLKEILTRKLCNDIYYQIDKEKYINELSKELVKIDLELHGSKALFEDPREYRGKNANERALKFVKNNLKSLIRNRKIDIELTIEGSLDELEYDLTNVKTIKEMPKEILDEKKSNIKELDAPPYLLGEIFNHIKKENLKSDSPNLFYGASINVLNSIIGGNVFAELKGKKTKASMFIFLLARSGGGKSVTLSAADNLLKDACRLTSGRFSSPEAIADELDDNATINARCDEISSVLDLIAKENDRGLAQMLCDIWSSNIVYLPNSLKAKERRTNKGMKNSYVKNVGMSYIVATTISDYKNYVNKKLFASGFAQRFVYFIEPDDKKNKKIDILTESVASFEDELVKNRLTEKIEQLAKIFHIINPSNVVVDSNSTETNVKDQILGQKDYNPYDMVVSPEDPLIVKLDRANGSLVTIQSYLDKIADKENALADESPERFFYNRATEQFLKFCVIFCINRMSAELLDIVYDGPMTEFDLNQRRQSALLYLRNNALINSEDATYAYELLETCISNSLDIMNEANSFNDTEKNSNRVLNIIKKSGHITRANLVKKTQFLDASKLNLILKGLIESEQIEENKLLSDNSKKPTKVYVAKW